MRPRPGGERGIVQWSRPGHPSGRRAEPEPGTICTWGCRSMSGGIHHPLLRARDRHEIRPPAVAAVTRSGAASGRVTHARRMTRALPSRTNPRKAATLYPARRMSLRCAIPPRSRNHCSSSGVTSPACVAGGWRDRKRHPSARSSRPGDAGEESSRRGSGTPRTPQTRPYSTGFGAGSARFARICGLRAHQTNFARARRMPRARRRPRTRRMLRVSACSSGPRRRSARRAGATP